MKTTRCLLILCTTILFPNSATSQTAQPLKMALQYYDPSNRQTQYEPLRQYLEKRLGAPVELVATKPYDPSLWERMELSATPEGQIDLVLFTPYSYVLAKWHTAGIEPLVSYETAGEPSYQSLIVVKADGPYHNLDDVKTALLMDPINKKLACVDSLSTSGYLWPKLWLQSVGVEMDRDIGTKFTHRHIISIELLDHGGVIAAASWEQTLIDYQNWKGVPRNSFKVFPLPSSILRKIPHDVIAVRPGLSPELKTRIRDVFLSMHIDPDGKKMMTDARFVGWIDRWIQISDADYEVVRSVAERLNPITIGAGTSMLAPIVPPDIFANGVEIPFGSVQNLRIGMAAEILPQQWYAPGDTSGSQLETPVPARIVRVAPHFSTVMPLLKDSATTKLLDPNSSHYLKIRLLEPTARKLQDRLTVVIDPPDPELLPDGNFRYDFSISVRDGNKELAAGNGGWELLVNAIPPAKLADSGKQSHSLYIPPGQSSLRDAVVVSLTTFSTQVKVQLVDDSGVTASASFLFPRIWRVFLFCILGGLVGGALKLLVDLQSQNFNPKRRSWLLLVLIYLIGGAVCGGVLLLFVVLNPGVFKLFPKAFSPATVGARLLIGVVGGLLGAAGLSKAVI